MKRTCNDFTNSSFCLKTGNTETVLGWHTNDVISENGLLRMEFFGEHCSNQHSKGEVTLHFVCNYASSPPFPEIRMVILNILLKRCTKCQKVFKSYSMQYREGFIKTKNNKF